jgi:dTDP-glucose 4,6-dehydratase
MRRDDGRVIPEMVSAALAGRPLTIHGNGSQTRSFCYVSDLVAGLVHIISDGSIDGEIFNVGNPHEITVRELAEHILEATGSASELRFTSARPGDPERRRPIIEKIQQRYGWEPMVHLRDGIEMTVASFREAEVPEPALANVAGNGRAAIPIDAAIAPA